MCGIIPALPYIYIPQIFFMTAKYINHSILSSSSSPPSSSSCITIFSGPQVLPKFQYALTGTNFSLWQQTISTVASYHHLLLLLLLLFFFFFLHYNPLWTSGSSKIILQCSWTCNLRLHFLMSMFFRSSSNDSSHFNLGFSYTSSAFWFKKSNLFASIQFLHSTEVSQPPQFSYFYHFHYVYSS